MARRLSAATERALARVAAGETPYHAAKAEGLSLSTIYRQIWKLRRAIILPTAANRSEKEAKDAIPGKA
jgi:hypothetical protein